MSLPIYKPASIRKLEKIYASLPKIECKRLCGRTNCGPVLCSKIENRNIRDATGSKLKFPLVGLTCPHLSGEGDCTIYEYRPIICRLFGLVDVQLMRCSHGCIPERWLSDQEATDIMRAINDL